MKKKNIRIVTRKASTKFVLTLIQYLSHFESTLSK